MDAPQGAPGFWSVMRHGGRSNDKWRLAAASLSEATATAKYTKIYKDMRQGGLVLLSPDGREVRRYEAPLLRTIW
jgi:hypothetical protein